MQEKSVLLVEFGVGDQRYGLRAQQVLEILRFAAMTPIPSSPPHVRGALNLRGEMVVVTDLRILMGVEAEERPNTPILLVESHGTKVGLVADEIFDVDSWDADRIQDTHDDSQLPAFVTGVMTRDSHFLYIVSPQVLLSLLEGVSTS